MKVSLPDTFMEIGRSIFPYHCISSLQINFEITLEILRKPGMNIDFIMDLHGLDSCKICMETYDGDIRPRSLPCGHTICSCCVTNSIRGSYLKCPHCQRSHNATSVNIFPINYDIETLIEKLREAKRESSTKVATSLNEAKSVKNRTNDIIAEQKNCLRNMVKVSGLVCSDIEEFQMFLRGRKKTHQEIAVKISTLLQLNEEMIKQVESEEKRIDIIVKEGEKYKKEANDNLSCDKDLSEMLDLVNVSEKLQKICETLENWNDRCMMHLPCKEVISSLAKIEIGLEDVLSVVNTNEESAMSSVSQDQHDSIPSLMEKVEKIRTVTDSDFQNSELKKSVKFLLRRGEVGAVQFKKGQIRHSRVTVKDGKIYLHCLQDGMSSKMACFKHSDFMETLDKESVVVFLDLTWEGSIRGRVHILLSPDTPLARHFKALCSGELGPSYKNTKFLEVLYKGDSYIERVTGGDYEKDDGKGGAPLFTGLKIDDEIYERKLSIGSLGAAYKGNNGPKSAQFRIIIGTQECKGSTDGIFGQVQDGLDVVRDAAKLDDIKKVTISDCGIVLPL